MIENLRPLTQEQRQAARQSAREAVIRAIGPKATQLPKQQGIIGNPVLTGTAPRLSASCLTKESAPD